MLRSTKVTVALLFVAYAIDYIDRLAINLALPLLGEEFDLDYSQRGLIISTFFIAYTLAQLPGGLLADRYGAVRVALIGLVAWSVFTGLTALAWSFGTLLVVRFLFGLAQGVFEQLGARRDSSDTRAARDLLTVVGTGEDGSTGDGGPGKSAKIEIGRAHV